MRIRLLTLAAALLAGRAALAQSRSLGIITAVGPLPTQVSYSQERSAPNTYTLDWNINAAAPAGTVTVPVPLAALGGLATTLSTTATTVYVTACGSF